MRRSPLMGRATRTIMAVLLATIPHYAGAETAAQCKSQCNVEYRDCAQSPGPGGASRCLAQRSACIAACDSTTPQQTSTGTLRPKYYILTVIYAPPGTQGGGSSSSVSYGSGSTTGSSVSVTNSFKQNYSVSVTATAGVLGTGTQIGMSFGYSKSESNSQALDIKKSATSEISVSGPSVDGIDHDRDEIWLWLNPKIDVSLTPTTVAWKPAGNLQADLQYVYVGWLKNPSTMPTGVVQQLALYGITTQDYPEILKADPFANASSPMDHNRYRVVNTTFPYEPPYAPGDPVPTYKFNLSYDRTSSGSTSVQREYTISQSKSGDLNFITLFEASAKSDTNWTWTDAVTRSTSATASELASVSVGGPAYGYMGRTDIAVYYDVLYKTFLFTFVDTALSAMHGSVKTASGSPVRGKEVVVVATGIRYRTFTDAYGEYRIYGRISGPLRVEVSGTARQLPQLPSSRALHIVLP